MSNTVFAEISAHQKQWFSKGGSTWNRWAFDGWCFQRGEYTKPMEFWWVVECFLLLLKIKRPGRLFRQIRYFIAWTFHPTAMLHTVLRRILYGVCLPLHWTSTIPSSSGSCSRISRTRWTFVIKDEKDDENFSWKFWNDKNSGKK